MGDFIWGLRVWGGGGGGWGVNTSEHSWFPMNRDLHGGPTPQGALQMLGSNANPLKESCGWHVACMGDKL